MDLSVVALIGTELGLLYALLAVGVYLTYRVLDFPDLTVDGSFTTGAALSAVMILNGVPIWLALIASIAGGMAAGVVTGLLHVWGNINALLAGILTQIALYSVNLRIMGKSNVPLLRETTLMTPMRDAGLLGTWGAVGIFAVVVVIIGAGVYGFLGTGFGVAIRATGDNELMARSQGINTGVTKVAGLAISNGLVALCGAIVAQYQGYADISMGIGLIIAGLASVIIGQAVFGATAVWQSVLAAVLGSIIYRIVIQAALGAGLNPNDTKIISAILVVVALVLPQWSVFKKMRQRRRNAEARAA